jgi:tetratricopeptide (TPR) repeat protein
VTARPAEGPERLLVSNGFSVASDSVAAELAELAPLAAGSDPADVLLAAASYRAHGLEDEALALFERLSQLAPAEPAFHAIRADYYQRAGRLVEARAARARAAERAAVPGGESAASPPSGAGRRK